MPGAHSATLLAHTRELTCPNRDPGCQAGGAPARGGAHAQEDQRVVVLGRAAVIAEFQRLEGPPQTPSHWGSGLPLARCGTQLGP